MKKEANLLSVIAQYAAVSFMYALLCGTAHGPGNVLTDAIGNFQVYAVACGVWFALGCVVFRPKRLWPPTMSETRAAFASVIILTSETLALMSPASLIYAAGSKAGCLLIPHKGEKPKRWLAALAISAVILASLHKPLKVFLLPCFFACCAIFGYWLKLGSVRMAKGDHTASQGFMSAGQVVVVGLTLSMAAGFSHLAPSAPLSSWHLWLVGLFSLGAGLTGMRIMLHSTKQSLAFPAYRAASLVAALGATAARGEHLGWNGWLAVAVALVVVFVGAGGVGSVLSKSRLLGLYAVLAVELAEPRLAATV